MKIVFFVFCLFYFIHTFEFQECDVCLTKVNSITDSNNIVDQICNIYTNSTSFTCKRDIDHILDVLADDDIEFTSKTWCRMASLCTTSCCESENPEQVHISVTGSPNEMDTKKLASDAFVKYYKTSSGSNSEITVNNIPSETYYAGGWRGHIYKAVLINLQPSTSYSYTVGTIYGQLGFYYNFTTPPETTMTSNVTFIAYGDMSDDSEAKVVMNVLQQRVLNDSVDLITHIGDISYAGGDQSVWDSWMRDIAPVAATIPYMAVEGNHESTYLFAAYRHRFRNPSEESGSNTTKYFSFDYGNIHFLAFTFEDLLDLDNNPIFGSQRQWIEEDLQKANQRRDITPWIVAYAHRPLYCTYTDHARCIVDAERYRFQLESVFYDNKVDLVLNGHNHNYERTYPVYKRKRTAKDYTNPEAPVYVVQGSAGRGLDDGFRKPAPGWSVTESRRADYGFSEISTIGNTTLTFSWIQASSNTVQDSFTIQRT